MTGPIDPVRRATAPRRSRRRGPDRRSSAPAEANTLPVLVTTIVEPEPPKPPQSSPAAAYAAHLLGQSGQKRGLRAPETLETARTAYLGTEYSGPQDRRPRKGRITKTEV